jgi:hypothetical protein
VSPLVGAARAPASRAIPLAERLARLDWQTLGDELDTHGCARLAGLLTREDCEALAAGYAQEASFRSRVVMARHGFGHGEYKYFAAPLPGLVAGLRRGLYPPLARIANRWSLTLGSPLRYPDDLTAFLARCHAAGQEKPTPLLLRYEPGDYNRLHEDLYGEHAFALQVTFLLSAPGTDFTGGEFVLSEQRPRLQSRVEVVPLGQGDGVVFPVRHRPVPSPRGSSRATLRHGVSRVRSGRRYALGVIFHDAR